MTDFQTLIEELVSEHRQIELAYHEFRKLLDDDRPMRDDYREWCHSLGCTHRQAFLECANDFMDRDETKWDVLDNSFD